MTRMNEMMDEMYESLDSTESAVENIKALWNSMLFSTGDGKRRVMSEIVAQIERAESSVKKAQSLAQAVLG